MAGNLCLRMSGELGGREPSSHPPTWMGVGKERPPEEQRSIELLPYLSRGREAER